MSESLSSRSPTTVVLVFDVGGTRLKAGLVGPDGIGPTAVVPTDVSSADALIEQIVALGEQLLHGERPHGAGRGVENLVCLTLGTGIGVGVVTEGRLLRGGRGALGALAGHITVDVDGPPCTCGSVGCLEALIGSHGLIADARTRARDHPGSRLATEGLDPEAIFSAAADGDAAAFATVERFTHVLACGVVSLIHVYDPDLFVVGGGLAASAPQFLEQVQQFVDEHAWTQPKGRVRLALSTLGDTAALLGAAELAASAAEAS